MDCTALTDVTLGNNVTFIERNAFYNCTGLTDVYYDGTIEEWNNITFEYGGVGNECLTGATIHFAGSEEPVTSGQCGDNVYWSYDEDTATLTISGEGKMYYSFDSDSQPWSEYQEELQAVIIKEGVTSIGSSSFYNCCNMKNVTISNSVTYIGNYAFFGCTALENVYYGGTERKWNSIRIQNGNECLISVEIQFGGIEDPHSGQCGDNVFWSYDEDTATLTISGEGEMRDYDWDSQPWLTYRNSIKSVFVEDGVTSIGWFAFGRFPELISVTMPNSVTCIGVDAFAVCSALTSITIPDGVRSILPQAFVSCTSLESVMIPKSVNSIGEDAFSNCKSMVGFAVDEFNPAYTSDDSGCLYNKDKTELLYYPAGNERTGFSVPNSVTHIAHDAFKYCYYLMDVAIPGSVKAISAGAFSFCSSLISVEIENGLESIGSSVFWWCENLQNVSLPDSVTSIGAVAFFACFSLTNIIIPNGLETIESEMFQHCSGLREITIPSSVTTIKNRAFCRCYHLNKVTILNPDCEIYQDAETIEESATIYGYPGSTAQAYAETYGRTFVALCPTDHADTTDDPGQPATCTEDGYTAGVYCNDCEQWIEGHEVFPAGHKDEDGDFICDVCGESTLYTIHVDETLNVAVDGNQLTYIAFTPAETGFYALTSVSEEDTYGYLYDSEMNELDENDDGGEGSNFLLVHELIAGKTYYYGVRFYGENTAGSFDVILTKETVYSGPCGDNATWTLIPATGELRIEGEGALWEEEPAEMTLAPWNDHMMEIESVVVDEGITNIPANAFFGAIHLTGVSLPESLKTVGMDAFFLCTRLTYVYLPDGVETIACNAFQGCTSLCNIRIPDSVTFIDVAAFANCPSLYEVVLPEGLTTLEGGLFLGDYRLNAVTIPASVTAINGAGVESPFTYCYKLEKIENHSETAVAAATGFHTFAFPEEVEGYIYLKYLAVAAEMQLLQAAEVLSGDDLQAEIMTRLEEEIGDNYLDILQQIAALDPVTPAEGMPEALCFYCFSGSAEHAYCEENNIPFVLMDQGQCGDDVYFSFDNATGTLTISGTGAMWDSGDYDGWSSYRDDIQTVVIENGVTSIGWEAFSSCTNLTDVTIPNSVETIDEEAFSFCGSLASVTIPSSVSSIGDGAFRCCPALASIKVDAENQYYSSDASGCLYNKDKTELIQYPIGNERTEFSVPQGVKVIGVYAFQLAEKLGKVTLPDGLETISGCAFYLCEKMTEINIPETVTVLGEGAFYECSSLTSFVIPSGVTRLDEYLFAFCCNLVSLTIPDSVTDIEQLVFFPGNTEEYSFALADVYYLGTEAQWNAIEIDEDGNGPLLDAALHFIVNDDTGVSLSYDEDVFDPDVEINITEIPTGDENSRAWNITPTLNGEKVQPNGRVQVKLPIPAGWDKTKIVLRHIKEDGSVEYPEFTVEGDFVVFWAEEFSEYTLEQQVPHAHTYDEGVVTKAATCKETGVMTYTCTTCEEGTEGHTRTETIPVDTLNHASYGTTLTGAVEPGCETAGYTGDTVCNGCGAVVSYGKAVDALGHTSPDSHGNCERCGAHLTDVCKWCGGQHEGFFQKIIGFFHRILASIFGAKY